MSAQAPSMTGPLINLALVYGLVQVLNKFDLDNIAYLNYIRALYIGSQLIQALVLEITRMKIKAKNDETPLVYKEPKGLFDNTEPKTVSTTVKLHDLARIAEAYQQMLISVGLMIFLHFQYGYLRPLILQSVLGFRTMSSTPLFQIYILGKAAEGDLKRPFKKGFMDAAASEAPTPKEIKSQEKKAAKKKLNKEN
ncbi:phosphate transporter (Pho88) [Chytridiales sp. JEL 0842]|nr:phosphate transporter (Pho88) [Chytridiales sp. JEL 0842]